MLFSQTTWTAEPRVKISSGRSSGRHDLLHARSRQLACQPSSDTGGVCLRRDASKSSAAGNDQGTRYCLSLGDTISHRDTPLEFVLIDAPTLDRPADLQAFVEHFTAEPVAVFPSSGGGGILIVPCPINEFSTYSHLAAFVRTSSPEQYHRLLKRVAVTAVLVD